jgi:hypothetical protein
MEIHMELQCRRCKAVLDADEGFYKRKGSATGYQHECKTCRSEINKKYKKPKKKPPAEEPAQQEVSKKRGRGRPPGSKNKKGNKHGRNRVEHRRFLLEAAGPKIGEGMLIADTSRSMTFNLSLIVEQQLKLFYGREVGSAPGRIKMGKIIEDTLFEVKEAFSRAGKRMKPVISAEEDSGVLAASLAALREKAEARALLGVDENATHLQIRAAYRTLAKEHHPDHNGATNRMQALNQAFELLVEDQNGS